MKKLMKIIPFMFCICLLSCSKEPVVPEEETECIVDENYQPVIDPGNFITDFTVAPNPYFPLTPGVTLVYEGQNDEGLTETINLEFTNATKIIMGVTCMVVRDRVYLEGELIEDTDDWFAQDIAGNVWYFGEDVKDYENGVLISTDGSWEAGVDGALPGIRTPANPFPGNIYRQEYYACEAEDMAQDITLGETITVPYATFSDCLKTIEWTPLEPGVSEEKYYAPGVGYVKIVKAGTSQFIELVDIL